jgi:hypothetical protein
MYYRIDKDALYALVDAEVSRAADEAYAEDGTSLYDTIVLTEKDADMVEGFLADAISAFVKATSDISSYKKLQAAEAAKNAGYDIADHFGEGSGATTTVHVLDINVPDMDTAQQYAAMEQINRFVVLYACSALFQQRRSILVPEYSGRAQGALDNAIAVLRKRNAPSRT